MLWLRVMILAITDYCLYRDETGKKKSLGRSAEIWLFEPNDSFNGLENICRMLALSADDVRARARRFTKEEAELHALYSDRGPQALEEGHPGVEDEDD